MNGIQKLWNYKEASDISPLKQSKSKKKADIQKDLFKNGMKDNSYTLKKNKQIMFDAVNKTGVVQEEIKGFVMTLQKANDAIMFNYVMVARMSAQMERLRQVTAMMTQSDLLASTVLRIEQLELFIPVLDSISCKTVQEFSEMSDSKKWKTKVLPVLEKFNGQTKSIGKTMMIDRLQKISNDDRWKKLQKKKD